MSAARGGYHESAISRNGQITKIKSMLISSLNLKFPTNRQCKEHAHVVKVEFWTKAYDHTTG